MTLTETNLSSFVLDMDSHAQKAKSLASHKIQNRDGKPLLDSEVTAEAIRIVLGPPDLFLDDGLSSSVSDAHKLIPQHKAQLAYVDSYLSCKLACELELSMRSDLPKAWARTTYEKTERLLTSMETMKPWESEAKATLFRERYAEAVKAWVEFVSVYGDYEAAEDGRPGLRSL